MQEAFRGQILNSELSILFKTQKLMNRSDRKVNSKCWTVKQFFGVTNESENGYYFIEGTA